MDLQTLISEQVRALAQPKEPLAAFRASSLVSRLSRAPAALPSPPSADALSAALSSAIASASPSILPPSIASKQQQNDFVDALVADAVAQNLAVPTKKEQPPAEDPLVRIARQSQSIIDAAKTSANPFVDLTASQLPPSTASLLSAFELPKTPPAPNSKPNQRSFASALNSDRTNSRTASDLAQTTFVVHISHPLVADILARELGQSPDISRGFTLVCRKWAAARRDGIQRDDPSSSSSWQSPFHTFWIQEERQEEQRILFPAPFSYKPAPPSGLIVYHTTNPSQLDPPSTQPSFVHFINAFNNLDENALLNVKIIYDTKPNTPDIKDWAANPELILIRNGTYAFVWYLKHHQGMKYATIPREISDVGLRLINAPSGRHALIGVGQVVDQVKRGLASYQNPQKGFDDIPRGFLFWGPPGTGKTTIVQRLSQLLNVKLLCDPLTPGSFNQGIVGDSERMINTLAEWAKSIPWHVCVVAIDEIDGLAPSRENAQQKDSGKTDIIGVLLALIGGIRNIPNLVLFGSTNLLHTMDAAFLRRMNYKIFIGRPSFDARRAFVSLVANSYRALNMGTVPFSPDDRELVDEFVKLTLNFSTDAVFKALNLAADNWVADGGGEPLDSKNLKKYVRERAVMEKILFGGRYLPDILTSAVDESRAIDRFMPITRLTDRMSDHVSGTNNKCTGRILVQLIGASRSAEETKPSDRRNQIQVETVTKAGSSPVALEIRALLFSQNYSVDNMRKLRESLPKQCSFHLNQPCTPGCSFKDMMSLHTHLVRFEHALQEEDEINRYKRMTESEMDADHVYKTFTNSLALLSQISRLNRELESRRQASLVIVQFARVLGRPEDTNSIVNHDIMLEHLVKRLTVVSDMPMDLWRDLIDVLTRRFKETINKMAKSLESAIRPVTQFTVKRDLMHLEGNTELEVYTKDEIMYKLLDYGINKDVSYIQLIDNGYLLANNRLDEASAKEALLQVTAEASQYHSSILLFDLDSIAQIRTELRAGLPTTGSIEEPDENRDFVINRQDLFTMAVQYFKDLASQNETRHWVIAISEHAHILRLFKESVNWPKSNSVHGNARSRDDSVTKTNVMRCVHCEQMVSRKDRSWTCSRHRVDEVYSQMDYEISTRTVLNAVAMNSITNNHHASSSMSANADRHATPGHVGGLVGGNSSTSSSGMQGGASSNNSNMSSSSSSTMAPISVSATPSTTTTSSSSSTVTNAPNAPHSPRMSLKYFTKHGAIDYARRTGRPYTDMRYRCCGEAVYGPGCLRAQHETSD